MKDDILNAASRKPLGGSNKASIISAQDKKFLKDIDEAIDFLNNQSPFEEPLKYDSTLSQLCFNQADFCRH